MRHSEALSLDPPAEGLVRLTRYLQCRRPTDVILALPFRVAEDDLEALRDHPGIKALVCDREEGSIGSCETLPRLNSRESVWHLPNCGARQIVFAGPWWRISMQMIGEARRRRIRSIVHHSWGMWIDSSPPSLVAIKIARRMILLMTKDPLLLAALLLRRMAGFVLRQTRRMAGFILLRTKKLVVLHPWQKRLLLSVASPQAWNRFAEIVGLIPRKAPVVENFRAVLAGAHPAGDYVKGRIVLVCGSLQPGGAERQVLMTLLGLAQCGFESVRLLCDRLTPDHRERYDHFLPLLQHAGIEARSLTESVDRHRTDREALPESLLRCSDALPKGLVSDISALYRELRELKPEVVHAWLDWTNVRAGVAAVLAGVPKVVVSGRNINPSHFALYQNYMDPAYLALSELPNVVFVNNSRAGAVDYARWLDLPESRFRVIYNGVALDGKDRADDQAIAACRAKLGIPKDHMVVGSMYRLHPEKRPLLWIECAVAIATRRPKTSFVVYGQGPLYDQMRRRVRELGLVDRIFLPGVTNDVVTPLSAMDVFLLTSFGEGTPNVALEAQWLGTPVVATEAGGIRECIEEGITGSVLATTDPKVIAQRVIDFLDGPHRSSVFLSVAKEFVSQRFGVTRMIRETVEVYGYTPESIGLVEDKSHWIRPDAAVSEHRKKIDQYLAGMPFAWQNGGILKAKEFSMLSWEVLALLHYFARLTDGAVLELGPYMGASTIVLAKAAAVRDAPIITVEKGGAHDHPTLPSTDILGDLKRNLQSHGVSDRVRVVEGKNQDPNVIRQIRDAVGESKVGLLVIDADGQVERDIVNFAPLCRPYCYLVIDDYVSSYADAMATQTKPYIDSMVADGELREFGVYGVSDYAGEKATQIKPYVDRMVAEGKLREFGVYGFGTWVGQLVGQPLQACSTRPRKALTRQRRATTR